jgi:hypothetical protein
MTFLHLAHGADIPHRYLTRHIGIFGATGTGKSSTLAAIAERAPCPVLIFDAKGDLESLGSNLLRPAVRVDSFDADLMSRAIDLSDAQAGALQIVLAWCEDSGFPVVTLGDLRVAMNAALQRDLSHSYGLLSPISVAAVQRSLLRLEREVPWLFSAAEFDPRDTTGITVYSASGITPLPGLYGAFVAHCLDALYNGLGEVGDVAAPGLLVLIDESHLLFDGATPAIVRRIEQITRLIRSKGVGLVFATQSPSDLPSPVAGQLATRIQHALRASTPQHHKALKAAAETMPGNISAADILGLATGQAIASIPDATGKPVAGRVVAVKRGQVALHSVGLPEPLPCPRRAPMAIAEPVALERKPVPFWLRPAIAAAVLFGLVIIGNLV